MEHLDQDFSLYKSDSFRRRALDRSLSSRMLLESSVSSECALIAKYERLSQSMRFPDEPAPRQRKCGIWRLLAHVLLIRRAVDAPRRVANRASVSSRELLTASSMERIVAQAASTATPKETEAKKKKQKKIKRRSSWLPDPERRWPIQGW